MKVDIVWFKRPWGPGILYELVFYFLEAIKSNNCFILGWDLSTSGKLNHFYDNSKNEEYHISNIYSHEEIGTELSYRRDINFRDWCKS